MSLHCDIPKWHSSTYSVFQNDTSTFMTTNNTTNQLTYFTRTQDTLSSLYKRYSTLNQQLAETRAALEKNKTEYQQSLQLATARDNANIKLQRKLDRLYTTYKKRSTSVQDQLLSSLQQEHHIWKNHVDQQRSLLVAAQQKTLQSQQQLLCLRQIARAPYHHHHHMQLHLDLLDLLTNVRTLYDDWIDRLTTEWLWILLRDDNEISSPL
ncbi:uncharacterized protein BX664DRAFT_339955 [Halteromyces radiatus]|uniref:uncharacterized protein n=1 Tax=Halteromyces radiatus TaxID=101107 RepID=UPI00221F99AC|nr:uncharacterized protein BX664DRAFT_339955 [Halteromyces radiatus]KAI8083170.1 hypothetical protein BX664DRAFT_339955 [Halteromyces radiatus]